MKTQLKSFITSILLLSTILLTYSANANVWRVNNRTGVEADFSSLATAVGSALVNEGDTIYLEASAGSHGNVTINKRLVIIGPGFFLSENPETQADINSGVIGRLTLESGSSGTIVKGCRIENLTVNASDIIIWGNHIQNDDTYRAVTIGGNVSNIIIANNYIYQVDTWSSSSAIRAIENNTNNVLIRNNYIAIQSTTGSRYSLLLASGFQGIIENNVLYGNIVVNNAEFHNNILITGGSSLSNVNYTHNIGNGTQFGSQNGNQQNVNMSIIFIGSTGDYSTDARWQLAPGSPAIAAGVGGTDIGMFGGSTPYKLSGIPNIPAIYEISHTINYLDEEIEVEFSVKSHN